MGYAWLNGKKGEMCPQATFAWQSPSWIECQTVDTAIVVTLQLYTHYAFLCEQHISLAHVQALEWGLDVNLIAI